MSSAFRMSTGCSNQEKQDPCLLQLLSATPAAAVTASYTEPPFAPPIRCLSALAHLPSPIMCIAVSEGMLFAGCEDGRIRVWKEGLQERGSDLIGHCGPVTDVAALGCCKEGHGKGFVVSGSTDGSIRLWGGKHEGILWSVVSESTDGSIRLWVGKHEGILWPAQLDVCLV